MNLYPHRSLDQAIDDPKLLNESNTKNLSLTIPQILPHNPPVAEHIHPSYLNAACLPFANDFYNCKT